VTIEQVHVVPQPFGSLFRALISPEGRVTDPEGLATCKVGVLDIGTHTTDAILSDHLTYVEVHSGSIPVATGQLYDLVRRAVADRYDLELTRPEIADVVETGKATAFGKQLNARHLVDEARASVARQVVAFAQTLWGDAKTYATIILTGGGGVYFEPQVRAAFPHAHLAADAQLANAQGFYRYGALKAR
jgi:plasmid segregation protein ParM